MAALHFTQQHALDQKLFAVLCIIAGCPVPVYVTHVSAMCRTVWLMLACAMTAGVCTCTALAAVPAGLMTATLGEIPTGGCRGWVKVQMRRS
jgi:hypothetical protein